MSPENAIEALDEETLQLVTGSMPDDPRYGYLLSELLEIEAPTPPDDFESFWREMYSRARAIDVAVRAEESSTGTESDRRIYDIEFDSLDGVRLGGWFSVPETSPVSRGLIVGHGYGGREAPEPEELFEDAAVLYFCSRGLPSRSLLPEISPIPHQHVLTGINRRETYILGGCAADLWCAVTALSELLPSNAKQIGYMGTSFGGGLGALALPWDSRVVRAWLVVPSFGNQPLRLTLQCAGSGEALRWYARSHPSVMEVLRYFDAATAAMFACTPTHVGLALADPVVPPPGQFAIYNALAGPKASFILTAGHLEYPEMDTEAAELLASQRAFAVNNVRAETVG